MAKASNDKGKRWERDARDVLTQETGFDIRRGQAGHSDDRGDLFGVDQWTIGCKDWARTLDAIRDGLDEMAAASDRAGTRWYINLVKRRQHPARDGYAVMTIRQYGEVLAYIDRLENALAGDDG